MYSLLEIASSADRVVLSSSMAGDQSQSGHRFHNGQRAKLTVRFRSLSWPHALPLRVSLPPPSLHHHHLLQSCNSVPPSCIPALSLSSFVVVLQSSCSRLPVSFAFTLLYFYLAAIQFVSSSTAFSPLPTFFPIPLPLPSFLLPSPRILTPLLILPLLLHYAIPFTPFAPRYSLHSFSSISTTPSQVTSPIVALHANPESLADSVTLTSVTLNNNNHSHRRPDFDHTSLEDINSTL